MELDEYLKALENCPDEFLENRKEQPLWRLTAELGVYDNWPIFLKADFESVVRHLQESNYRIGKTSDNSGKINHLFFYNPGTVELQVMNYVSLGLATRPYTEERRKHYEKQERDFNMGIILHPYQEIKMNGVGQVRAIAMVIGDIGKYAQKENIPICFPNSVGWDNLHDFSKIVYFYPR